jgi:hypothetical protein
MMIIRWNKKNVMLGTKFTTAKFNQKLSHIPVYNSTLQLTLLSRFMVTIIRATLEVMLLTVPIYLSSRDSIFCECGLAYLNCPWQRRQCSPGYPSPRR